MFQRRARRFRRNRMNGRKNGPHNNSGRMRTNQFSNGQSRNNFRSSLSAEKSLEKYTLLAKEAMSAGDKTSYENYLQHADHYARIIGDKNKNKNITNDNTVTQPIDEKISSSSDVNVDDKEKVKNET